MNDPTFAGLIVLLVAVCAGRWISERSYKLLTTEEKAQMLDAFAGLRRYSLVPLIVLVGGLYLLVDVAGITSLAIFGLYFVLLLVYAVGSNVYVYHRMKTLFPMLEFLRLQMASRLISVAGLLGFVGLICWDVIRKAG